MTVAAAGNAHRARAEAMTMAVADALAIPVQMPEVMALMFVAMRGNIARAEQRQRGYADRKHRKLPGRGSSDADEMAA